MDTLAYLDPGSGSIALQVLLGGAAGVAVLFKLFRSKVARLFRRSRTKQPEHSPPEA